MTPKVKLLDWVRAVARAGHLSHRTEDTYHNFIRTSGFNMKEIKQTKAQLEKRRGEINGQLNRVHAISYAFFRIDFC